MQQKGRFITFEGGEGTGKSTQLRLLAEYLERAGVTNVMSKEPGGTEIGQELRRILVTGDKDKFDAVTECLLYYADSSDVKGLAGPRKGQLGFERQVCGFDRGLSVLRL